MQALEQMLHEKSWGGEFFFFAFLADFYAKLGGKFTKVGGGKYTRSVSLRNGGRGQGWGEPCSMAFGGDRRPWLRS